MFVCVFVCAFSDCIIRYVDTVYAVNIGLTLTHRETSTTCKKKKVFYIFSFSKKKFTELSCAVCNLEIISIGFYLFLKTESIGNNQATSNNLN